jgi:DNA gyrase subunit A
MVGAERVIEKIKDAVNAKKLTGIADVNDLTDRNHGLRLVIGIKTGFDPAAVLEQLYRLTPLEDSFGINNVALVDGQPQTLGLKPLLRVYLDHRIQVVTRRSRYRLARKQERLHLVEGLLIAILDIDEVIQVIRASDDTEQARAKLMSVFDLSQVQAEYILELRLRRLTRFSRIELESEQDTLKKEIADLQALLASDVLLRQHVARELDAAAETFGTPRRTLLLNGGPVAARSRSAAAADLQIADSPCRVLLSATGRMVRAELGESGEIVAPTRRAKHDGILSAVDTTTRGELGAVTTRGRLVRFSPVDLPSVPANAVQLAAGTRADQYLGLGSGEHVVAVVPLGDVVIALGTAQGVVKRVATSELAPGKHEAEIIALKDGDLVVGAAVAPDGAELVFVASDAQLLRFDAASVRPQGARRGHGRSPAEHGSLRRGLQCGDRTGRCRGRHDRRFIPGDRRNRRGQREGVAVRGVPAEGPRHRRCARPALPEGRGRPHPRLGRYRARGLAADGAVRTLPDAGAKRDASGHPLDAVVAAVGAAIA